MKRQHLITALLIFLGFGFLLGGHALAQDIDPDNTVAALRLSALGVSAIVSLFIPLVVGFVTTRFGRYKGIVSLLLNAVQTLIVTNVVESGEFVLLNWRILITWLLATAVSVATYYNVWKPLELTSSDVQAAPTIDGIPRTEPGRLAAVGRK